MSLNITYNLKMESERRNEKFTPTEPLSFGQLRTDHMFLMNYDGKNWVNPRIVPYEAFSIMPGAVVFHYGQEIFEGAKVFKHSDGELYTFRIDKNAHRMNASCDIMCMPHIPVDDQIQAIHALIDVERLWFPEQAGSTLYVRPFIFGSSDALSVNPSKEYIFCIFLSPSGAYYTKGFTEPVKLLITDKFHRAVSGGTGAAKAGGNYAMSLRAAQTAKKMGASQVLYLDSSNTFIEEAGAMNHYHILKDGTVVIPEFTDTILRSVTSESILELSKTHGYKARQEKIRIDKFIEDVKNKEIVEAGGFGTAAVVSAVGTYVFDDGKELLVGDGKIGKFSQKLYDTLTGIQLGKIKAPHGWLRKVEKVI